MAKTFRAEVALGRTGSCATCPCLGWSDWEHRAFLPPVHVEVLICPDTTSESHEAENIEQKDEKPAVIPAHALL